MTKKHPITPPPELVQQWYNECPEANEASLPYIATQAARWGADMELEACVKWFVEQGWLGSCKIQVLMDLRAARRPKPPSLKEQALTVLDDVDAQLGAVHYNILRRALEALPND